MKILFTRKLFLVGIFLFLAGSVFGQGTLQGVVADSLTKEPLFGATILIVGTSQGAATDFNGEYKIPNLSEGRIKVKVSYVGYATKTVEITIKDQKISNMSFLLSAKSIEGQTITITAQAQGQLGAINQQLSSNTIMNAVSADKIRQLPDDNAATALSRLPGVSLMNGDQVVIRGVEAKLNQVLINGIEMPSTDFNNRSTNLGFISSNMLAGIEVIKAITPDMDANTIGGVVNLKLASAQPGLHFDVMAQGNYNSTDRTANTYKFWGTVSNRFFDDALGVIVNANADRSDGGNQSANLGIAGPDQISHSLAYGQAVYLTTSANFGFDRDIVNTTGGSLLLDYKLPHGKIVMQNMYSATNVDQRNYTEGLSFGGGAGAISYGINRNKYGKELWVNGLQAENSFGDLKVELSLSHSFTDQYTDVEYDGIYSTFVNGTSDQFPYGKDASGHKITYSTLADQMNMPWSRVFSIFDNTNTSDVDSAGLSGWPGSGYTAFKQHLYNGALDFSLPVSFSDDVSATFKAGGKYVRTTRSNDFDRYFGGQNAYEGMLNYFPGTYLTNTHPVRFDMVRDYNFTRGQYFLGDEYNFQNGGFKYAMNTDIYDTFIKTAMTHWVVPLKKTESFQNDWDGAESFAATYIMGTFNIFDNITVLGGVRYEAYNMNYHAQFTFITHSVDGDCISTRVGTIIDVPDNTPGIDTLPYTQPDSLYGHHAIGYSRNNVNRTDRNLFPGVQVKYKLNDWADLRAAYTTGISRPDYTAIMPKVAVYPSDHIEMGNPLLRPTTVKNFDVIASVYGNKVGLLTVNGFYKELKDVVYYNTGVYYGQAPLVEKDVPIPDSAFLYNHFGYTPNKNDVIYVNLNNPNTGYIRGVEIDWQTNFWYLPEPFNSLVLSVNYTKSASSMAYRQLSSVAGPKIVDPLPPHHQIQTYVTRDTVYVARLTQQANDVLNANIGVDYKGFSGRFSFNLRGNVLNNVGNRPEETSYTGNILRWDFTLKQDLPVDGLSISLNGINIFHNAVRTYRNFRLSPDAPITENLVSILYGPTFFQMNLRYIF